jgi:hypothetical protein
MVCTAVYPTKPFELAVLSGFGLKFEFERYLAVYRGIPRYKPLPPPSGKNATVGKKNPARDARPIQSEFNRYQKLIEPKQPQHRKYTNTSFVQA